MKVPFLTLWSLLPFVVALVLPRDYEEHDEVYNVRKHPETVQKTMIQYWSRPDVLPHLPEGMKEMVEIYIKQYPEYQYRGSPASSVATSKKMKSDPCNTQ